MNIGVICSDERLVQVSDNLASDFKVIRIDETTDLLALPTLDAIVFPVKGPDELGYQQIKESRVKIPSAFWKIQDKTMKVFCGLPNEYLEQTTQPKLYYMKEEEVIKANAILTAEGVLNQLIGCICKSIYDIQVDVIGYGNCGKVIFEMLKNLHVKVRAVRRTCANTGDFISIEDWKECGDVIINTSYQPVMDEKRMMAWKKKPVILDIATPDVIDLSAAKALGIKVIKAGNLPGRFACISAGNIIAEHIRGKLINER